MGEFQDLLTYWISVCSKLPSFKSIHLLSFNWNSALQTSRDELAIEEKELLDMAKAGARALWSLSESRHNKELMRKSGIVPLMGRLLKSVHIELVVPIMVRAYRCLNCLNEFLMSFEPKLGHHTTMCFTKQLSVSNHN